MKLDELKKICDAATSGPWGYDRSLTFVTQNKLRIATIDPAVEHRSKTHQNGKFIATFNPETVRKLLAVAEAARDLIPVRGLDISGDLSKALAALESD